MDIQIQPPKRLSGVLQLPPDKAICHRAVLLAALASGKTRIHPWPSAEDCQRTLGVVRALGVHAAIEEGAAVISGAGVSGLKASPQPINCGESGTTFRLAAGILAGLPFRSVLAASPSLQGRPMRRIVEPLTQMGAVISGRRDASNPSEVFAPLAIEGRSPLKAIRYEMPVASAQVKSAVLLAGLFADGPTSVVERQPTRDHTERAFEAFGISITRSANAVAVIPGQLRSPGSLIIPGDISSAAFFIVAAACVPQASLVIEGVGLNPTRAGIISILRRAGASIELLSEDKGWEPRGKLQVKCSALSAITLEPSEVPAIIDELPILMVAAACARGTSRFFGIGELRVKETDRIQSMVNGLTRLGVKIRVVQPDAVEIEGGTRFIGAEVESAGDHRTAMSLTIAGLMAEGKTLIRGAECVAKSFPEFFGLLGSLTEATTVKRIDKP